MDSDLHMTFSVTEKYKCTNMFMSHNHFMHIFTCNSFLSYIDQIWSKIKVPHILFQKPSLIQYISWKYENPLRKQESLSCMHSRLIPPLFFHCALCSWIHARTFGFLPWVHLFITGVLPTDSGFRDSRGQVKRDLSGGGCESSGHWLKILWTSGWQRDPEFLDQLWYFPPEKSIIVYKWKLFCKIILWNISGIYHLMNPIFRHNKQYRT